MPARLRRYAVPVAVALLGLSTLTACGSGDSSGGSSTHKPVATPSSDGPGSGASSPTNGHSHAAGTGPMPAGGTADKPAVLDPKNHLLDWQPVTGSVDDTVTRSGQWTLTVNKPGTEARLEGAGAGQTIKADSRHQVSDALIDGQYAVVVLQDRQETQPSRAQVFDLRHGGTFTVDGDSDVPTTNGGTWALGQGRLLHATVHQGSYCVASVDLTTRTSRLGWCAPKRHGFNSARITPSGESLLTFDDSRPACRTVVELDGTRTTPFRDVADCKGWDGLVTDDGAVWSVVPEERQVETAHVYARSGTEYFDLGPAVSGSLIWCGGAAYFARDPEHDSDPAQLMRWSADTGLEVAYQSHGGHAFLAPPRCGGSTITITSLAQSGDEQVSADLG